MKNTYSLRIYREREPNIITKPFKDIVGVSEVSGIDGYFQFHLSIAKDNKNSGVYVTLSCNTGDSITYEGNIYRGEDLKKLYVICKNRETERILEDLNSGITMLCEKLETEKALEDLE